MKEKILKLFQSLREKGLSLFGKCADGISRLKPKATGFLSKWWRLAAVGIFVLPVLYYPAGALIVHRIDTNPDFSGTNNAVQTIGTLEALIHRETGVHIFTPNKPFFHPAAVLDDVPAFQTGVISGIKNAVEAFQSANSPSEKLQEAAERLAYPADVWHISKWKPAVSSVKKYRKARTKLAEYQQNVSNGTETFDRSPKALSIILSRLEKDIRNCVGTLAGQIGKSDSGSDDVFYQVKGQAYAYYLVLRDLKKDFEPEFARENLEKERQNVLSFLQNAIRMKPFFVMNGKPDSQTIPNHLTGMGFYLSRAAFGLNEMKEELQAEHE